MEDEVPDIIPRDLEYQHAIVGKRKLFHLDPTMFQTKNKKTGSPKYKHKTQCQLCNIPLVELKGPMVDAYINFLYNRDLIES